MILDPAPGTPISSPFGMRVHPIDGSYRMHYGSDRATAGQIFAAHAGTVVEAGWHWSFGWQVRIQGDGFWTRYAHMREVPRVRPGDKVAAGQPLGDAGKTGSATGVHLHWELFVLGRGFVDPERYIGRNPSPSPSPSPPKRKKKTMLMIYVKDGVKPGVHLYAVLDPRSGFWWELNSYQENLNNLNQQVTTASSVEVSEGVFETLRADMAERRAALIGKK